MDWAAAMLSVKSFVDARHTERIRACSLLWEPWFRAGDLHICLQTLLWAEKEDEWLNLQMGRVQERKCSTNKIQMYTFREDLDFMWSLPSFPFLGGLSLSLSIQNKMVGGNMQKSNIRSYRTQMFILEINFISMCFTNLMEMDWWNKKETSSSELCFRSLCSTDCTFLALDRSSEHSGLHSLPPYSIIIFQGILFALDWNKNWVFSTYWISVVLSSAWTPKSLLIDFNSISWINVKQHAEMKYL